MSTVSCAFEDVPSLDQLNSSCLFSTDNELFENWVGDGKNENLLPATETAMHSIERRSLPTTEVVIFSSKEDCSETTQSNSIPLTRSQVRAPNSPNIKKVESNSTHTSRWATSVSTTDQVPSRTSLPRTNAEKLPPIPSTTTNSQSIPSGTEKTCNKMKLVDNIANGSCRRDNREEADVKSQKWTAIMQTLTSSKEKILDHDKEREQRAYKVDLSKLDSSFDSKCGLHGKPVDKENCEPKEIDLRKTRDVRRHVRRCISIELGDLRIARSQKESCSEKKVQNVEKDSFRRGVRRCKSSGMELADELDSRTHKNSSCRDRSERNISLHERISNREHSKLDFVSLRNERSLDCSIRSPSISRATINCSTLERKLDCKGGGQLTVDGGSSKKLSRRSTHDRNLDCNSVGQLSLDGVISNRRSRRSTHERNLDCNSVGQLSLDGASSKRRSRRSRRSNSRNRRSTSRNRQSSSLTRRSTSPTRRDTSLTRGRSSSKGTSSRGQKNWSRSRSRSREGAERSDSIKEGTLEHKSSTQERNLDCNSVGQLSLDGASTTCRRSHRRSRSRGSCSPTRRSRSRSSSQGRGRSSSKCTRSKGRASRSRSRSEERLECSGSIEGTLERKSSRRQRSLDRTVVRDQRKLGCTNSRSLRSSRSLDSSISDLEGIFGSDYARTKSNRCLEHESSRRQKGLEGSSSRIQRNNSRRSRSLDCSSSSLQNRGCPQRSSSRNNRSSEYENSRRQRSLNCTSSRRSKSADRSSSTNRRMELDGNSSKNHESFDSVALPRHRS